jgi:hypothetical protein
MSMNEDTIHELRARAECAEARVRELEGEVARLRFELDTTRALVEAVTRVRARAVFP